MAKRNVEVTFVGGQAPLMEPSPTPAVAPAEKPEPSHVDEEAPAEKPVRRRGKGVK